MRMKVRNEKIEVAYKEMHGITPEISYTHANKNKYSVNITLGDKEVTLTETMVKGLTDFVILEYDGNKERFKSMYEAELRANELLRGKDGDIK